MKNSRNIAAEDPLKDLFREIPMEVPSDDFSRKIMSRIEKEAVKERKRRQWSAFGSLVAGIAGIICIPGIVFHLSGMSFVPINSAFNISRLFSSAVSLFHHLHVAPEIILLGCIVLMLLIGDTLLRKWLSKKKEKRLTAD